MRIDKTTNAGTVLIMILAAAVMMLLSQTATAGNLEPSAAPGPTMRTLDEIPTIWCQIIPAAKRFELVMGDEAVLDKETGLVWARDAGYRGGTLKTWHEAWEETRNLVIGGRKGWRLPTVEELSSLLVYPRPSPPEGQMAAGNPFVNVKYGYYWTATSYVQDPTTYAYHVLMNSTGVVHHAYKTDEKFVWPVRVGN